MTFTDWWRTCQECGHKQKAKKPSTDKELSNSYLNSVCRKCKSSALDYGTHFPDTDTDANT